MKRLAIVLLAPLLGLCAPPNAFGWGVYHGPAGGAYYRGPMGGAAARGPGGAGYVRGPYGAGAARGPAGNTYYRPPAGGAYYYHGPHPYYGTTTVVTPGVGVAAGVAAGAAVAGAAAASSAYAAQSTNYYPPPYYSPPLGSTAAGAQPSDAQINAVRQACRSDYMAHCASVPTGTPASLACLQQNAANVSQPCQQALSAIGGPATVAQPPQSPPSQARPSQAQINAIRQACRSDYMAHCSSVPTGTSASLACLQQNAANVSQPCQRALRAAFNGI